MPQQSYAVVLIAGTEEELPETTALVSALFAMGIEPREKCPFIEVISEREPGKPRIRHTWALKAKSKCGRWHTEQLRKAWYDKAWLAANPEHPFAYARAAAIQHRHALAQLKNSVPQLLISKGGARVLIPADATPEERESLMSKLAA